MKTFILLLFFCPFFVFAQQTQPSASVDLKMDNANAQLKRGKKERIIGIVATVVGASAALLAPSLASKPAEPTYLPPTTQANNLANSRTKSNYETDMRNYDKNVNAYRYAGAGVGVLGVAGIISGSIRIGKAKKVLHP